MRTPSAEKPSKAARESKEAKKTKSTEGDAKSALRRLTTEVEALRADVDALKTRLDTRGAPLLAPPSAERVALEAQMREALTEPADAAVVFAFAYRSENSAASDSGSHRATGLEAILRPADERIARLGYAFSSIPKVSLVRSLLADGAQSAAQLGEKANLSTGSLYHHLRELVHAEVIHQAGRSQYALTPLGQHAALLLFTIAGG